MTKPPANPFEWRRYVVEEDIRRGVGAKMSESTKRRRQALEPITNTDDTRLKPKAFMVYNTVRKDEGK